MSDLLGNCGHCWFSHEVAHQILSLFARVSAMHLRSTAYGHLWMVSHLSEIASVPLQTSMMQVTITKCIFLSLLTDKCSF